MVLWDISFTIVCKFMFIKPLTNIIKHNTPSVTPCTSNRPSLSHAARVNTNSTAIRYSDDMKMPPPDCLKLESSATIVITDEFKDLVVRYTVVTCVGLLSTFCALVIIGLTDCPVFSMPDVWINSVCLLLMCTEYKPLYKTMCCGLIHCVHSKDRVVEMVKQKKEDSKRKQSCSKDLDLQMHKVEETPIEIPMSMMKEVENAKDA